MIYAEEMYVVKYHNNFLTLVAHMNYLTILHQIFKEKGVRFFISGGSAALVYFLAFYACAVVLNLHYVWTSIVAYAISFLVSFTLQKFWTFRDHSLAFLSAQLTKYFFLTVLSLGINVLFIYILVEFVHLSPLVAQIITIPLIALWSFFVYQFFVFKQTIRK